MILLGTVLSRFDGAIIVSLSGSLFSCVYTHTCAVSKIIFAEGCDEKHDCFLHAVNNATRQRSMDSCL